MDADAVEKAQTVQIVRRLQGFGTGGADGNGQTNQQRQNQRQTEQRSLHFHRSFSFSIHIITDNRQGNKRQIFGPKNPPGDLTFGRFRAMLRYTNKVQGAREHETVRIWLPSL